MKFRSTVGLGVLIAGGVLGQAPPANPPQQTAAPTIFRTETRIVPVDVVVQDKKGNYVHDLEQKDFKLWEDNKEQQIKNFSFEADPASPLAQQKKYLVLFFDLSSMNLGDQAQARQAAVKFIDANAGPNRVMAIANFGGSLQIAQNFTDDIERLKQIVSGVKVSAVTTASAGGPRLGSTAQYGMRTMVMALSSMARNLADIPGRKTLVLFSAGFPLNVEIMSEITAAVDACNRANVAVYPVDVRGLTTNTMPFDVPRRGAVLTPGAMRDSGLALAGWPVLRIAALFAPQRGGTGTTGGGTTSSPPAGGGGGVTRGGGAAPGGGPGAGAPSRTAPVGGNAPARGTGPSTSPGNTTGRGSNPTNTGGGPSNNPNGRGNNPNGMMRNDPFNSRQIVPRFPETASTNQQVLYMLADGTGGFVIANTNDLLGGLQKISKDQNEYYLLAYTPPESAEGTCHTIHVKVSKGNSIVRARTGYCNVKQRDLLSGKPIEKEMETVAASAQPGTIQAAPMQLPFFYTSTNTARVHVAMDIPTSTVKFEKVKGKQHAEISVLAVAYRPDGNVAARFSDAVKRDFDDKKDAEKFTKTPMHYENQFEVGSGEYTLKVVFTSAGAGFGKLEAPLKIEPYDTNQFAMSALALSKDFRKLTGDEISLDQDLVEGKTPMLTGGMHFDPAGVTRFKSTDTVAVYFEVYEPLLQEQTPAEPVVLAAQIRVLDRASGVEKFNSGGVPVTNFIRAGSPVVPIALKAPVQSLAAGAYKLEMKVQDSKGRLSTRFADFDVQ